MRACKVYINKKEAGLLEETDEKKYVFTYSNDYIAAGNRLHVCIAMPVREEPYKSDYLFPYFFNMLSEGANRKTQSMLLHIDEDDDFGILLATAQVDTIGAVTIKPIK